MSRYPDLLVGTSLRSGCHIY